MSIITHEYHISEGKNYYTGLHQEGYDQWKLTLTTPKERIIFFRTSRLLTHSVTRFAIASREWSAYSFEEMIRIYSNCNRLAHDIHSGRMLFDHPVLSDAEIEQAVQQWNALQGSTSV